mgnify:CR=1 FL=1
MAHNYTTGQFTQEQCDDYNNTEVAKAVGQLNLYKNVSGTYKISPILSVDGDGNGVKGDAVDTVLAAGLSTILSDWRTANPALDGTNGTDIENFEYSRWNDWANVQDIPAHIAELEINKTACEETHAEMLATVE